MGRRSRAEDTLNNITMIDAIARPAIPVFRFHCGGFTHHPP
jgi:hypothetical protein